MTAVSGKPKEQVLTNLSEDEIYDRAYGIIERAAARLGGSVMQPARDLYGFNKDGTYSLHNNYNELARFKIYRDHIREIDIPDEDDGDEKSGDRE